MISPKQTNKKNTKRFVLVVLSILFSIFGTLFSIKTYLLEILVINPAGNLVFKVLGDYWSERHHTLIPKSSRTSPESVISPTPEINSPSPIGIVTATPISTQPYEVVSVRSHTGASVECTLDSSVLDDTSANELSLSFEGALHYDTLPSRPTCEVVITSLQVSPTPIPSCLNELAAVATLKYAMRDADGNPETTKSLDSKPECYEEDRPTKERAARLDALAEFRAALDK